MSNTFFSDLEEPQNTHDNSFFSDLGQEKEKISFPKIGFGKKVAAQNRTDEMKRTVGRTGKVVASTVAGLPGDIVSGLGSATNWLVGKIPFGKQASEEEIKPLVDNPFTSQNISKKIEEFAPSLKAQTPEEKDWEDNLSLITSLAIPFPGGKGKFIDPKKRNALFQAGKRLGLSEKELTPLFKSNLSQNILGKLAGKGKQAAAELRLTQNALGDVYETLKTTGAAKGKVSGFVASRLGDDLFRFKQSLQKTLNASPEKQNMINFLEKAHDRVMNFGTSPDELINFWQDINRSINWKSVDGGKKLLAKAKNYVGTALKNSDPILYKDFKNANELWARSEGVIKSLGANKFQQYIDATAYTALLGALVTGNFDTAGKIGLGLAGKKALAKVATKFLTDPKWQNLHRKALHAIKNKSPKAAQAIIQTLKSKVREEMPEDFSEIEWPES